MIFFFFGKYISSIGSKNEVIIYCHPYCHQAISVGKALNEIKAHAFMRDSSMHLMWTIT